MRIASSRSPRPPLSARPRQRGVTLVEVLVAVALAALLSSGVFIGAGGLSSARLRQSSTLVAGAIRVAYTHAGASSRPTRLVFDIEQRTITVEDTEGRMFVQSGDRTGGAAAATDAEQQAVEEAEEILDGRRPERPSFKPVDKLLGFRRDKPGGGKHLAKGIVFRQIEVAHEDDPVTEDRAYLYFWPGGQTELCAVQLARAQGTDVDDKDIITVLVAPLTGKVKVLGGAVEMPRPMSDEELSERQDTGP